MYLCFRDERKKPPIQHNPHISLENKQGTTYKRLEESQTPETENQGMTLARTKQVSPSPWPMPNSLSFLAPAKAPNSHLLHIKYR